MGASIQEYMLRTYERMMETGKPASIISSRRDLVELCYAVGDLGSVSGDDGKPLSRKALCDRLCDKLHLPHIKKPWSVYRRIIERKDHRLSLFYRFKKLCHD